MNTNPDNIVDLSAYRLKLIFDRHIRSVGSKELDWTLVLINRDNFERKEYIHTITPPPTFRLPRRPARFDLQENAHLPVPEYYNFVRRAVDAKNLIAIYEEA